VGGWVGGWVGEWVRVFVSVCVGTYDMTPEGVYKVFVRVFICQYA